MKVAIPTKSDKGLDDSVSEVFGKNENFVIVKIKSDDGTILDSTVVKNLASSYKHGSGPITVKMLTDLNVDAVAGNEFGLGVSTLLEQNKIKKLKVKANTSVIKALNHIHTKLKK